MQRPAEMVWSTPKCMGDIPSRRSGHSLSVVGDTVYLFGEHSCSKVPSPPILMLWHTNISKLCHEKNYVREIHIKSENIEWLVASNCAVLLLYFFCRWKWFPQTTGTQQRIIQVGYELVRLLLDEGRICWKMPGTAFASYSSCIQQHEDPVLWWVQK